MQRHGPRGAGTPLLSLMTLTASKTPSPRWNVTSQMLHLSDAAGVGAPFRDAKVLRTAPAEAA